MFPCSSEEPDEKKLLTEEAGLASAQLMDGDMQVNQAAYNYNAWYQVLGQPETSSSWETNSAPWPAATSWVLHKRQVFCVQRGAVWWLSCPTGRGQREGSRVVVCGAVLPRLAFGCPFPVCLDSDCLQAVIPAVPWNGFCWYTAPRKSACPLGLFLQGIFAWNRIIEGGKAL